MISYLESTFRQKSYFLSMLEYPGAGMQDLMSLLKRYHSSCNKTSAKPPFLVNRSMSILTHQVNFVSMAFVRIQMTLQEHSSVLLKLQ